MSLFIQSWLALFFQVVQLGFLHALSRLALFLHTVQNGCLHSHSPSFLSLLTESSWAVFIHTVQLWLLHLHYPLSCLHSHSPAWISTFPQYFCLAVYIHKVQFGFLCSNRPAWLSSFARSNMAFFVLIVQFSFVRSSSSAWHIVSSKKFHRVSSSPVMPLKRCVAKENYLALYS